MSDSKPLVYILHGDDEYAMAKSVDTMYGLLGDPTVADLNFTRLDGRTLDDNGLEVATGSMPFLTDRRLVVLSYPLARQPDAKQKAARARFQEQFLGRLNRLPETTALVLVVVDYQKKGEWVVLHPGHWLLEWAAQAGEKALVRAFSLPTQAEMQRWIRKQAQQEGGQFTAQAAVRLEELVGNDTRIAAQEITKLLTYVNFARPVEPDDVANLTVRLDNPDVFAMVDALGARDNPRDGTRGGAVAIRILHELLEKLDAPYVFGMIVRQFRLLLLTREIMDQGGGPSQVAEKLRGEPFKVSPFIAPKLFKQAGLFSTPAIEAIYSRLLDLDETFKSSGMEPDIALDTFIAELTA